MERNRIFMLACILLLGQACSNNGISIKGDQQPNPKGTTVVSHSGKTAQGKDWFNLDPVIDVIEGVSADKVYTELKLNPAAKEVVVAVIDSGVDIHHKDLTGKIWQNAGELGLDESGRDKASNGIDDDGNGYVDDYTGWNFIGGYDEAGKPVHIAEEQLEVTRLVVALRKKLDSGIELNEVETKLFERVSEDFKNSQAEYQAEIDKNTTAKNDLKPQFSIVKNLLGIEFEELTLAHVEQAKPVTAAQKAALFNLAALMNQVMQTGSPESKSVARLDRRVAYYKRGLEFYFNPDFSPRAEIVRDDPADFSDTAYGNNDVIGPDAGHGTHVAGIIAALRGNGLGIDGIASNVKIMPIRAVPDGDERDKDVALAIRYAVDNGAKIINMSFGKGYSPYKAQVAEAMQYAADKGVLLVHAAGNNSTNNDDVMFFPNRKNFVVQNIDEDFTTWLEVGASASLLGLEMVAPFSNYGKKTVDIFAPGFEVESTIPGDEYAVYSGTSMAAPVVAGVAALVLSQKPELSGQELKSLIVDNGRAYPETKVKLPGEDELEVPFIDLSITGTIVDAYAILSTILEAKN